MMTSATTVLLKCADAFCASRGLSRARLSTLLFNDGKTLTRVAGGKDVTTRTFESAMTWFSANWPEGLAWPEGIERPQVPTSSDEAAA